MILFFERGEIFIAVGISHKPDKEEMDKFLWLFGKARYVPSDRLDGFFLGPRREMITPWSTNAVEITRNMGIEGVERMEEFTRVPSLHVPFDPMLQQLYENLTQDIFTIHRTPEPVKYIEDIAAYNREEGLALSEEEVQYLERLSIKIGRKLTDSEVFGFSQVNSEHCRHKIFNGKFIIDGKEKPLSLFQLIKKTTEENPNRVVSAYKDNCAFLEGPRVVQFAPRTQDKPDFFELKDREAVISLKAETHNFPTTVEPFNGAATGSGGEIRDRMAGGKGAFPLAGTAVYMTSYPRLEGQRDWEKVFPARRWLYHPPDDILIKASNGASDFGNKFGQPLICGSVLTFEHFEKQKKFAYDKVVMLAGGVGYANKKDSLKEIPVKGDKVVLLGGDNYRIGMGGGAVSSVATGEYDNMIELNAVQRSNPEMQKRVYNAIRALAEADHNPVVSIHDHGAGGHLNCLSELVEATGGKIDMSRLPVGDPTLSAKEIIGNESQERMGLIMHEKDIEWLTRIAERERAPLYVIGETTGDHRLVFEDKEKNIKPIDLLLEDMFGNPPRTVIDDKTRQETFDPVTYDVNKLHYYLEQVLQLESVACKDWLTNKVDRSVTGRIAMQQCAGEIQLPVNNLGITALDYHGKHGIAVALGHAPAAGLIDPEKGSVLAIAEALTNIVWAPLKNHLKGVSLSANWMWPCKNPGEDARLYRAVEAASRFALELGINIPTGKDSLSMTQKYPDGTIVYAPGTVIISACAEVTDIRKAVSPVLQQDKDTLLVYIDFSGTAPVLGGSAFAQVVNKLGREAPAVASASSFGRAFTALQQLIEKGDVLAGHDISAGGLITTLLEMNFPNSRMGLEISLDEMRGKDIIHLLFSENPGVVIQIKNNEVLAFLRQQGIHAVSLGQPCEERELKIKYRDKIYSFDIDVLRNTWYKTSYLLDKKQSGPEKAEERYRNYSKQKLDFVFPVHFTGKASQYGVNINRRNPSGIRAAIVREKGVNGDREMAWSMYMAGFDVKDVHMTDLISGRETLEEVNLLVFVGGFSNSDVLGSAKGWAGAFLYNEKARKSLEKFYSRNDTLSLGVCNGCQLVMELGLIYPQHREKPAMQHNDSHKFESAFVMVDIMPNKSVMLSSLSGSRLGIWVAHGEGKFYFPYEESRYEIPMKYSFEGYPGNPNGSMYNAAAVCSADGRHLAMMPHLERAMYPWNWAHYPAGRKNDEITPWVEAFVNARKWIEEKIKENGGSNSLFY